MKNSSWIAVITILCLLLGLLISVQYRTQQAASSALDMQTEEDLVAILQELNFKRIDLSFQEKMMREDLTALEAESNSDTAAASNLTDENLSLAIAAETVAVQGPGISIVFDDADNLISSDLLDMINELWVSGAEAIAVNNVRIGQMTRISTIYINGNEKTLTVSGVPLEAPIKIFAIGDGEALKTGMLFPGGILDNLKSAYHLEPVVEVLEDMVLPAAVQNDLEE